MHGSKYPKTSNSSGRNAVILVDYTNVHRIVSAVVDDVDHSDEVILQLIEEIQRYATEQMSLRLMRTVAFASIPPGTMRGHRASGAWLANGIEPRLTYASDQSSASALELTLEVSRILHSQDNIDAFIILSGDAWYVPVAQELQRKGRFVLIASLDTPSASELLPADIVDTFFNARYLIENTGAIRSNGLSAVFSDEEYEDASTVDDRRPEKVSALENPVARQGLEIIETYFGQYPEVYLTPLLRKFTEYLEHDDEPKVVVNHLEECGAVWLEKRRGFPHNYTVLMVNPDHPDVQEIKELRSQDSSDDGYYSDESYADQDVEMPSY